MGFIVEAEIHFTAQTEPILHRTHVDQGNIKAASLFMLCQPVIAGKDSGGKPTHKTMAGKLPDFGRDRNGCPSFERVVTAGDSPI